MVVEEEEKKNHTWRWRRRRTTCRGGGGEPGYLVAAVQQHPRGRGDVHGVEVEGAGRCVVRGLGDLLWGGMSPSRVSPQRSAAPSPGVGVQPGVGAHLQGHEALREHFVEHLLGLLGRDHGEILHLLLLQVLLAQEQPENPGAAGPEPARGGNTGHVEGKRGKSLEKTAVCTSPPRRTPAWPWPGTRGPCEGLVEVEVKGKRLGIDLCTGNAGLGVLPPKDTDGVHAPAAVSGFTHKLQLQENIKNITQCVPKQ